MDGETLLNSTYLIDYAVEDAKNEFADDDCDFDTDPYHFVDRITEWLDKNQGSCDDCDVLAQRWLDDEGYNRIRERIRYFG